MAEEEEKPESLPSDTEQGASLPVGFLQEDINTETSGIHMLPDNVLGYKQHWVAQHMAKDDDPAHLYDTRGGMK